MRACQHLTHDLSALMCIPSFVTNKTALFLPNSQERERTPTYDRRSHQDRALAVTNQPLWKRTGFRQVGAGDESLEGGPLPGG
mmetsp:Transcript_48460/g.81513  ORF Transcript_48460/g.81513 Transcript_48460/m.81513 type:complete len:83 (+) Transcript_48460:83-331(+)